VRFRRSLAVLVVTLVSAAALVRADAAPSSFAWKVTGHGTTVYLVGSVHLLSADSYPLAPALEAAYADADLLVEEVDLGEMLAPGSQLALLTRGMLPAGRTLASVVSAETLGLVQKRVADTGLPFAPLARFKPWLLSLTLTALEWQKAGFDESLGLDKHFYDKARADGKPVQGLETVEFQISRFDGMSDAEQEQLLVDSLEGLETELGNIRTLTAAWKTGDRAEVERIVLEDLKSDPKMYERLLVERNRNWLPQIDALFARQGRALVVVGAAHLVGPDGLLKMLEAKGYGIEQL
jgi:uncharacterized protein YbaP (TraB family)